jgi:predicted PilT family ATPase
MEKISRHFVKNRKGETCKNLRRKSGIKIDIKKLRMRWEERVAHMGEERKVYRVLVGKTEGKRPLGTQRLILNMSVF